VDEYLAAVPEPAGGTLKKVRAIIWVGGDGHRRCWMAKGEAE